MRRARVAFSRLVVTLGVIASSAVAVAETLLVHLPSASLESSSRLANAVTALASHLNAEVPRLDLEVKIFRRWEDAHAFYQSDPDAVTAILSEPAFLLDLPTTEGFTPMWRFSRGGSESHRLLLVVHADNDALRGLSDLQGKNLTFVKTTGEQSNAFLARAVFGGEIAPETWFANLEPSSDDFTAVAAVLHGQVDAALVADHNPLLQDELGTKLVEVFASPRLSNPLLSLRTDAFDAEQQTGLLASVERLADSADGASVLSELGLDGLRPVRRADRQALLTLPSVSRKRLEIALPVWRPGRSASVAPAVDVEPSAVTFALAIELPNTQAVSALEPTASGEPKH